MVLSKYITQYVDSQHNKKVIGKSCPLRRRDENGRMNAVTVMIFLESAFGGMCDEAFCVLEGTLKVCCAMLLCSLALLLDTGGLRPDTYFLYRLAASLESDAAGVLLVGNFAALFLERFHRR